MDAILEADRKAPRKQRHTAHRIWERIQSELPECKIAERTVREYVHDRKIALGLLVRETCVPQSYAWGVEAQVDWYEAYADLAGERTKLQVFAMRSMASGAAFHCAYLHATQQAFLEAHELAFAYFGGVFRKLRYDNLTSAVKKISARTSAGRDGALRGVPFALAIRSRVLHAGRAARERRHRRRSRILPPQPLGAGAAGGGSRRSEPAVVGGVPAGRTAGDRRTRADGGCWPGDRARASACRWQQKAWIWRKPAFPR